VEITLVKTHNLSKAKVVRLAIAEQISESLLKKQLPPLL
jgi:hypothetical protein